MGPAASFPMTAADAVWLHMDRPESRMIVTAMLSFDELVPIERVRRLIAERLVAVYPRFSRRVIEPGLGVGPPRWELYRAFSIEDHVIADTLAAPQDEGALADHCGALLSEPLNPHRPLWQIRVLTLSAPTPVTALVVRIHHAIADGISLARVILDLADQPPALKPFGGSTLFPRPPLKSGTHLWQQALDLAKQPRRLLSLARTGADMAAAASRLLLLSPDPDNPLRGTLGPVKRVAWCSPRPLAPLKATSRALGLTLNDALLSAMAGALRRYLVERGAEPNDLRAFVPVNLRPMEERVPTELGNHFSLALLTLPLSVADPLERAAALKRHMDRIKDSEEPSVAFGILNTMGMTPPRIEDTLLSFFGTKGSAVMTNVPGPREAITLSGHRVSRLMFWVPMSAGVALGMSIFSYAGEVMVGLASDATLVPDPERIAALWEDELAVLHALVPAA